MKLLVLEEMVIKSIMNGNDTKDLIKNDLRLHDILLNTLINNLIQLDVVYINLDKKYILKGNINHNMPNKLAPNNPIPSEVIKKLFIGIVNQYYQQEVFV